MQEIKDTGIKYIDGDRMLEGDNVEFQYMATGAIPEKVKGVIVYKNAAFYFVSEEKDVFTGNYLEKTIASILENNAQVPHKHPMNIIKLTRRTPLS